MEDSKPIVKKKKTWETSRPPIRDLVPFEVPKEISIRTKKGTEIAPREMFRLLTLEYTIYTL